ncbi:hypothetical protein FQR65_LT04172 [Abscondita terminalis]|nr:hypothetical protein FQR65_LT04172 [Abscondita terminalis]
MGYKVKELKNKLLKYGIETKGLKKCLLIELLNLIQNSSKFNVNETTENVEENNVQLKNETEQLAKLCNECSVMKMCIDKQVKEINVLNIKCEQLQSEITTLSAKSSTVDRKTYEVVPSKGTRTYNNIKRTVQTALYGFLLEYRTYIIGIVGRIKKSVAIMASSGEELAIVLEEENFQKRKHRKRAWIHEICRKRSAFGEYVHQMSCRWKLAKYRRSRGNLRIRIAHTSGTARSARIGRILIRIP